MDKKIVVLIQPGLPFRRTIRYGNERAREIGAKLILLSISPEFTAVDRMAFASYEIGPYANIEQSLYADVSGFFDKAVQYCRDTGIVVETLMEQGGVEQTIRNVVKDKNVKMVVVPTPTKEIQHEAFIDTLREFAHNMLDQELFCPVVSVLAT